MTLRTMVGGLVMVVALATMATSATNAETGASLRIEPAVSSVGAGATFTVTVVQDAPVATSGAQASIDFDPAILQVVSVSPGSAYAAAPVFVPQDMPAAIRLANQTGRLTQVAAAWTPPNSVPAGPASFLIIRFRAVSCGQTDLGLPTGSRNVQMISGEPDAYGVEVQVVSTTGGHVTTCVGDAAPAEAAPAEAAPADAAPVPGGTTSAGTPVVLVGGVGLIGVGLFGALVWRSRRRAPAEDDAW